MTEPMSEWQPIETAKVGAVLWLTDDKIVIRAKYLGPYRTGHCIEGRFGWFNLTKWMDVESEPAPPGERT